ncbi:MAG: 60S ribosomal export protein NMD3 [Desulfurococcaceae archaeon]
MWFCVKCGKRVPKEELIRGYCIDCFTRNIGLLERVPEIKLTVCPKCGSWLYQGEWNLPLPESEILESVTRHELRKYLVKDAELQALRVSNLEYVSFNTVKFNVVLNVLVNGRSLSLDHELTARISRKQCPRCVARSTGKYNYLVQIRFTEKDLPGELLRGVLSAVLAHVDRDGLINAREVPEGVDLELDDISTVKKILDVLHKKYAARINTSFRATRYDAHQGRWIGVTTYVARIPVFSENGIVTYRGRIGLVKFMNPGKLILWFPSTDLYEEIDIKEYWRGLLKPASRIEREVYTVKDINGDMALLENTSTGDVKRVKLKGWLKNLKPGDTVNLVKVDGLETFTPRS